MERKNIFLILAILITVSVLCAGCTTQSPTTVTPTPVPTVTTTAPVTTGTTTAPITTETTAAPMTTATTGTPMTPGTTVATTQAARMNIVETLAADGRFTTLVTALEAAQLEGNLSSPGPFTVFAPTDNAFEKLPGGTVDSLLKNPQGYYLKKLLTYHVVNGELKAANLMRLGSVNTVQGQSVQIDTSNGIIFLNGDTKVISTDIVCSNGVIHVIDTVLNPPE